MLDRPPHALAAVPLVAVTQLDGLVGAGAGAARDRCPAAGASQQLDLDLDGRVPTGIEDLASDDLGDGAHTVLPGLIMRIVGPLSYARCNGCCLWGWSDECSRRVGASPYTPGMSGDPGDPAPLGLNPFEAGFAQDPYPQYRRLGLPISDFATSARVG